MVRILLCTYLFSSLAKILSFCWSFACSYSLFFLTKATSLLKLLSTYSKKSYCSKKKLFASLGMISSIALNLFNKAFSSPFNSG